MIITITGKPCSGKGTVSKEFCNTYNFKYVCTGDMFREFSKQFGYDNILSFQENDKRIKEIDKLVDDRTIEMGLSQINEDIVIDSRLAWHFIPNSFKVFIDIDDETAGKRLLEANRETEKAQTLQQAIESLKNRWNVENTRYQELYKIDNLNLNNYDFVINSANLTPKEVTEKIYQAYVKFLNYNKI